MYGSSRMILRTANPQEVGKTTWNSPNKKSIIVLTGTAHSWRFLVPSKVLIQFLWLWNGTPRQEEMSISPTKRLPLRIQAWLIYLTCRYGFRHRGSIKDGGSAQQNRNWRSFTDESDTEEGKEQDCTRVSMSHSYGELAKEKQVALVGRQVWPSQFLICNEL